MKFRLLNEIYADLFGYFWIPCPLCGEYFGGHEWKEGNDLMLNFHEGQGVCPDCGDKAKELNLKMYIDRSPIVSSSDRMRHYSKEERKELSVLKRR